MTGGDDGMRGRSERRGRAPARFGAVLLLTLGTLLSRSTSAPPSLRAAPIPQVEAPDLGVEVKARPLYGGWVDPGRWTAVAIDLELAGGKPGQYRLGLHPDGSQGFVATELELSAGGPKQVMLLLPVSRDGDQDLHLSLAAEAPPWDGPPITQVATRDTNGGALAVVVSGSDLDLGGLEGLGKAGVDTALALERPQAMPGEALALLAVDHLVLADLSWESLEAAQQEAIRRWVGLGGHLVVTGGPSAARTLGSIPAELRPAQVLSTRQVPSLSALGALAGGQAPAGPATLALLVPEAEAEVLLSLEDGAALAVRGRYGDGRVTFLALDPFQQPLRSWDRRERLWQALAEGFPLPDTALSAPSPRAQELTDLLRAAQARQPVPVRGLAYLLLAYVVLVGPLNYLFLRRRRRLDLAWVTIPLCSLAASGLTYAYGRYLHGGRLQIDELSLVRAVPGAGVAHVSSLVTVFAPQSRAYSLDAALGHFRPPEAMTDGLEGAVTVFGRAEGSRLADLRLTQWSQGLIVAEAVIPWPKVEVPRLSLAGSAVTGLLSRPLGKDLAGAQLAAPGGFAYLDEMSGDQARQVRLDYEAFEGSSLRLASAADQPRQQALIQALRQSLGVTEAQGWDLSGQYALPSFRRPDALLLGFREEGVLGLTSSAPSASLRGLSLVHGRLPIDLGQATLRLIAGSATLRGAASGECSPGAARFSADEPRAEFSFPLGLARPAGGRLWLSLVHEAGLAPQSSAYPPYGEQAFSFTVALWDGAQGQWLAFDRLQPGQSVEIPRMISREQGMDQVRLRLEAYQGPDLDPDLWDLFAGCVEPRLALQEGLSPSRGREDLAPAATDRAPSATEAAADPTVDAIQR